MILRIQKSKIKNKNNINYDGYTLVELLVVLLVFSILSYIIVQSLALSLRGSRKSENINQVKENIEYAMSVMERNLKNAKAIVGGTCSSILLTYQDYYNTNPNPFFSCVNGSSGFIASGSARLTSNEVFIDCTTTVFNCPAPQPGVPPSIEITLNGRDANSTGAESAQVTSKTRILLRAY